VGLMVKNMCFLLRGHKFKSRGGYGMYTSVDFTSKIVGGRRSNRPIWIKNILVSNTNLDKKHI
jgi:hypothetical protein